MKNNPTTTSTPIKKNNKKLKQELHPRMLTDLAYKIACKHFFQKNFTFQTLWSKVWNKATDFKNENVADWIGIFYADLCQDARFLVCGPTTWCLKESITLEKAEKIANTMFLYEKDDLFEEGYEEYNQNNQDETLNSQIFEVDEEIQVDDSEEIEE